MVRLKRLNRGHLACNIKTEQTKKWYRHEPVQGVRDWVTRLTVGYVLNATETGIDYIAASLQHGLKACIYWFELKAGAGELPVITPIPLPKIPSDTTPTVRPKSPDKSKKVEGQ